MRGRLIKTAIFTTGALFTIRNFFLSPYLIDILSIIPQEPTSTVSLTVKGTEYRPATSEKNIIRKIVELGYDSEEYSSGCVIWNNPNQSDPEIYNSLKSYEIDLKGYKDAIIKFEPIPNVLEAIIRNGNHDVCSSTRLHPDGINGLFPSNQLSLTNSGYVEPLTPPMRDQKICYGSKEERKKNGMLLDYLVHDFEAMCRKLKPHSRIVLIDMGASLQFHNNVGAHPMLTLLNLYEKFGFVFDHIYAFEITHTPSTDVYGKLLPEKYFPSYHWINVGVNEDEGHRLNPLNTILSTFNEDDLIVVKLDIDHATTENKLVEQILKGGNNGIYHKLIDHFYFEHHVRLLELKKNWGPTLGNKIITIKDTLELFSGLRQKGIASHFWP